MATQTLAEQIGSTDRRTLLFRVADEMAQELLAGWSQPVRLRLEPGEGFYYDLVCTTDLDQTKVA